MSIPENVIFFDIGETLGYPIIEGDPPTLSKLVPFPYIYSILERLKSTGVRLGLISNSGNDGADAVDAVLAQAGILDHFEANLRIYSSEQPDLVPKPAPDLFVLAAEMAGEGARCFFVGEDPRERAAAKGAGLLPSPHPLLVEDLVAAATDGEPAHLYYARVLPPSGHASPPKGMGYVALRAPSTRTPGELAILSERALRWFSDALIEVTILGATDLPTLTELYLLYDDEAVRTGAFAPGGGAEAFSREKADAQLLESRAGAHVAAVGPDADFDALHFHSAQHGHTVKFVPMPSPDFAPNFAPDIARAPLSPAPLDGAAALLGDISPDELARSVDWLCGKNSPSTEPTLRLKSRHLAHPHNRLATDAIAKELAGLQSDRWTVRRRRFTHRGLTLDNIEAELEGLSPELILVTAHLDSTAGNDPDYDGAEDSAPGADDDASGVAAVLALASRFVALSEAAPLARSVRFVLFNAEEEGLVGSQIYARAEQARGTPILATLQMDMIGYNAEPPYSWEIHAGYAADASVEIASVRLARLAHQTHALEDGSVDPPQLYHSTVPGGDPADGRSDHSSFHAVGYPAIVASTDFFKGPTPDAPTPEPNPNYHSVHDQVVHPEYMAPIVRTIGRTAWRLAEARTIDKNGGEIMAGKREFDTRGFARSAEPDRVDSFDVGGLDTREVVTRTPEIEALSVGGALVRMPEDRTGISLVDRAISYAQRASGFTEGGPAGYVPDPHVQKTSAGASAVHLHQYYKGLPLFQTGRTVRFDAQGRILDVLGEAKSLPPDLDTQPKVSAETAVLLAATHVQESGGETITNQFGESFSSPQIELHDWSPEVLTRFPLPTSPTLLDKGPFEQMIPANLVVFVQPDRARLAWSCLLTMPDYTERYLAMVAADVDGGELIYFKSTTHHMKGRGLVYETNPGHADRVESHFPRPLSDYPITGAAPLAGFPADWIDDDPSPQTVGNAVRATLNNGPDTLPASVDNGVAVFAPEQDDGDDQKLLNIFYFCNVMHDFFYALGFDEGAGNFQRINFTAQGAGNDPVRARAHSGAVWGTANMSTYPDGTPPVMNMGMVTSVNRHTAFDADVVFHEFVHGLTNRLVGGAQNAMALDAPQSGAMGEGWSDYYALTLQNYWRNEEKIVSGDWVTGRPGGIRRAPYDESYPFTYGKVNSIGGGQQISVHDAGEIWCATLMSMTRRIRAALGDDEAGYRLTWQMIADGLKLTPANPNFLEARDAILSALQGFRDAQQITGATFAAAYGATWEAFAKFGMGDRAFSLDSGWSGVTEDFTTPPLA